MTARAAALAEFRTEDQIKELWEAVLNASIERVSVNVHINASSKPDGRASSGITLATIEEQEAFMRDCQAALATKRARQTSGATLTDLSQKPLRA